MTSLRFPTGGSRLAMRHRFAGLAVVATLVACAVAMAMAALLPQDMGRAVPLDAIAAALRGTGDAVLLRTTAAAPPDRDDDRWATATGVERRLAAILRVDPADVRLAIAVPMRTRPERVAGAQDAVVRAGFLPLEVVQGLAVPETVPAPVTKTPVVLPVLPPVQVVPPAPSAPPAAVPPASRSTPAPRSVTETDLEEPAMSRKPASVAAPKRIASVQRPEPRHAAPIVATTVVPAPAVLAGARPGPVTVAGPMPEIRGRFQAALRLPTGGWAIVEPRVEPFPTAAQQLLALAFLVALAVTAPLTWGASLWLARPFGRFAGIADHAGRDAAFAVASRPVPAELQPAVTALARLQGRVQALIADRTAFAGTLRTELQAPLTRLRAGLDDAPHHVRAAFQDDVRDIEDAVAALRLFLADAAEPIASARYDLRMLVAEAVAAATSRGQAVAMDQAGSAPIWVDVDGDAIARLLGSLFDYARRQDGAVVVHVASEAGFGIVTAVEGPRRAVGAFAVGLPARAERSGGSTPVGPGLAVARSTARSHGGEVRLVRSDGGMTAELRLPIAEI